MGLEQGGCLCGAIRYEFDRAAVISAAHCHCRDCQQATGGGKATIVFVADAALTFTGKYKTYTVIGTEGSHVSRGFCPECGAPLVSYVAEQPDVKFIKAGSLDNPDWVKPQSSYWSVSAQHWDPVSQVLPASPGNPD